MEIVPPVAVGFSRNNLIFPDTEQQDVAVRIVSNVNQAVGRASLELPATPCSTLQGRIAIAFPGPRVGFGALAFPFSAVRDGLGRAPAEIYRALIETARRYLRAA